MFIKYGEKLINTDFIKTIMIRNEAGKPQLCLFYEGENTPQYEKIEPEEVQKRFEELENLLCNK